MNSKPTVLILRGIPGAGKTHYLANCKHKVEVFSADNFFWRNGAYRFDATKLAVAHASCFRKYLEFIQSVDKLENPSQYTPAQIAVDNTNLRAWEIAPYLQVATSYGLPHKIITIWTEPDIALKRGIHNVPSPKVFSMYQVLLAEQLPPHWNTEVIFSEEQQ